MDLESQCFTCGNYLNNYTCLAFLDRIPEVIVENRFDHRNPYPDAIHPVDRGHRWELSPLAHAARQHVDGRAPLRRWPGGESR